MVTVGKSKSDGCKPLRDKESNKTGDESFSEMKKRFP